MPTARTRTFRSAPAVSRRTSGLSKNQPYCDGSHKLTHGEEAGKLYWYDGAGTRHEAREGYPDIPSF